MIDINKMNQVKTITAKLVQSTATFRSELGEAPIYIGSKLLWLDVLGSRLFVKSSNDTVEEHNLKDFTEHITTIVPINNEAELKDTVLLGTTDGIALYDLSTREYTPHPSNPIWNKDPSSIPKDQQTRGNDGKADPLGRLWIGSLVRNLQTLDIIDNAAGLYVLDGWSAAPIQVLSDISISNGVTWHAGDNKMYYTDSPTAHIDVMDFNTEDSLETICNSRRPHIKISDGYPPVPDGCICDQEGYVWSALFGAGCVRRYHPVSGNVVAEVQLPIEAGVQSTAVAWGGANYGDLYITSAHEYWTEEQKNSFPLAGCLFKVDAQDIGALCDSSSSMGTPPFKFNMKSTKR